uniref:RNA-directed DNA polymerase n=2 Tax=Strongyloides stercoralis TaxID=6248 RepID=A0A0K0DTS7_STRER
MAESRIVMNSFFWSQISNFEPEEGRDIAAFIAQLERCFVMDDITDGVKKESILRIKVSNEVNTYIDSLDVDIKNDYRKMVEALKNRYTGTISRWPALQKLRTFSVNASTIEGFRSSVAEFKIIMNSLDRNMRLDDKIARLAEKLKEDYLFNHLRNHHSIYKSFEDCCADLEAVIMEEKSVNRMKILQINKATHNDKSRGKRKFDGTCDYCKYVGHKLADCKIRMSGLPPGNYPEKRSMSGKSNENVVKIQKTNHVKGHEDLQGLIIIPIRIGNYDIPSLADAGSTLNLIRYSTIIKLGLENKVETQNLKLQGAFGETVKSSGMVKLCFTLCDKMLMEKFTIIKDSEFVNHDVDVLMGISIWRKVGFAEIERLDKQCRYKNVANTSQTCNISISDPVMTNAEAYERIWKINPMVEKTIYDGKNLGCYHKELEVQDCIEKVPISFKPYNYPPRMKDIARKMLEELEVKGVIKRGVTENLYNVLIVKKPNGSFRTVTDLRTTNKNTKKTNYPAPNISIVLNTIAGADYYCTLDLLEAFHQFPLNWADHGKFGIYFEGQVYYYIRMPMGYINAPMLLQKEMNAITEECPVLKFFFDDGLIATKGSLDSHLKNVESALMCLMGKGLNVSLDKSVLVAREVSYLGHFFNKKGIAVNPTSRDSILRIRSPKNQEEVRKFLGSIGFFQRFIPRYSQTLRCITDLLGKNKVFNWTKECEEAFKKIKQDLIDNSELAVENLSKPLIVYSDASQSRFGGVICQNQEDNLLRPLLYFSKKRKHTIKERDSCYLKGMCIILMTRKYRYKFLGAKVIWYNDNLPLIHMLKRGTEHPTFAAWCMELSCYDISFRHVSGVKNSFADFLSRFGSMEANETEKEDPEPRFVVNFINLAEMVQAQKEDEIIKTKKDLIEYNGLWVKFEPNCGRKLFKPYIPDGKMKEIIEEQHKYGHFGEKKLLNVLKIKYINDHMARLVRDCVGKCIICAKRNQHCKRIGMEKVVCYENPRENFSIDLCGPINSVGTKEKYILMVIDGFSRFWMTAALKTVTTEEVRENMFVILHRYGYPKSIRMDNAPYIKSTKFTDFLKEMGIEVSFTVPYSHTGNSLVERSFHTLEAMLNKCMQEDGGKKSWTEFLPLCTFHYNTAVRDVTQVSRYELFFGTMPNLPTDIHYHIQLHPH